MDPKSEQPAVPAKRSCPDSGRDPKGRDCTRHPAEASPSLPRDRFPAGMTSVTFREKSIPEITAIAHAAGLSLIEWGADRHVRPGDRSAVSQALSCMERCGISCPSYGSYYRVGDGAPDEFRTICETAAALGAGTVRTWLGRKSSAALTKQERQALLRETRELAEIAEEHGLLLAFEFHGGTLNDSGEASVQFLADCGRENVKTYWQPLAFGNSEENLRAVLPWLCTVHVFNWDTENRRYPLSLAKAHWQAYADIVRAAKPFFSSSSCPFLLEFVPEDSDAQFLEDAAVLKQILTKA